MSYFDGYLIPVPSAKLAAYREFSERVSRVYREHGAVRVVECELDREVANDAGFHAEGARDALGSAPLRDFPTAADVRPGETVILSWTEWPSREARDAGLAKALADPRIKPAAGEGELFEGRRLIAGGFIPVTDV